MAVESKSGIVYLELSIKALNYLNVVGFKVVPVTIAYTNKSFGQNIDSAPTRFLCRYSFSYTTEEQQAEKLKEFSDTINNSELSKQDVKK